MVEEYKQEEEETCTPNSKNVLGRIYWNHFQTIPGLETLIYGITYEINNKEGKRWLVYEFVHDSVTDLEKVNSNTYTRGRRKWIFLFINPVN